MDCDVPGTVLRFISNHIRSLDQLEVLLLVNSLPDREWSVVAIDAIIRSNPEMVSRWLEGFVRLGVLSKSAQTGLYRYQPSNHQQGQIVADLAAIYKTSRHRVIELIYSGPPSAIRSFAEAFKFRNRE